MNHAQVEPNVGPTHRRFALFAGANALVAVVGAVALGTGATELSPRATSRLPLASPIVGAIALIVVVAGPLVFLTRMAWRGHYATTPAASLCGFLLIGWVAAQALVLREFNLFQPAYAVIGLGFIVWGYVNRPANLDSERGSRLYRLQHALEDIAATVDPGAIAATAEEQPSVDEVRAPGHQHRIPSQR